MESYSTCCSCRDLQLFVGWFLCNQKYIQPATLAEILMSVTHVTLCVAGDLLRKAKTTTYLECVKLPSDSRSLLERAAECLLGTTTEFLLSTHSACLLWHRLLGSCISLTLFLMTKGICMKTGSLFPKCSSVPAVYFPPQVIILGLWHHNWLLCKPLCRHKQRIMTSGGGDKQQEQMNSLKQRCCFM